MNNSEIKTLEAQLGIKPIIEERIGEKYLLEVIKFAKFSSPTKPIITPINKLIANT